MAESSRLSELGPTPSDLPPLCHATASAAQTLWSATGKPMAMLKNNLLQASTDSQWLLLLYNRCTTTSSLHKLNCLQNGCLSSIASYMARNGQVTWDWCFVCWNLCKTCQPNRGCFRAALSQHGKGPMCTLHITPYCPSLEMFRTTVNHPFQRTIKQSWSSKRALIYSIQVFISTFWCSIQRGGGNLYHVFSPFRDVWSLM